MASGQTLAALAFEEQTTSTANKNANLDYRFKEAATEGETLVELYVDFGSGDRNEHSVAIADPTTASMPDGGYYRVVISDGTISRTYIYKFTSGELAATVAERLAPLIDTHPSIQAWQDATATDTIKILGNINGLAITVTVDARNDADDVAVAGAISSTEDVVASGTGESRKVAEYTIRNTVVYDDETLKTNPTLRTVVNVEYYNGSPTSPAMATGGAFGPWSAKHPNTIATLAAQA